MEQLLNVITYQCPPTSKLVYTNYDDVSCVAHCIELYVIRLPPTNTPELLVPETGDFSTGLDLSHHFQFSNVCGTRHSTNLTLGWTSVIDYIFVDSNWLRVVPFPAPEHLTENVALPSINFPSDHVALVADLTWKTEKL